MIWSKREALRTFYWDLIVLGLTTGQSLWVILCRLPERGSEEIEEILEEMKQKEGKKEWKWRNRRNKNIPPIPLPAKRIAGLPQL